MGIILTWVPRNGMRSRPRNWLSRDWTAYQLRVGSLFIQVVGRKWWGLTAWSSVRVPMPVRDYHNAESYREIDMKKRTGAAASASAGLHLAAVESNVFGRLHPIVAHCCHTQYDDGTQRKPGWVTVKTMGSAWVVEAKDPDTCSRLTVVQSSLDDALALLSVLLESEEAPWESDPWMKQSAARGAKK